MAQMDRIIQRMGDITAECETACWGRQAVASGDMRQQRKEGNIVKAKKMPYALFFNMLILLVLFLYWRTVS